jgi:hypothetical protein
MLPGFFFPIPFVIKYLEYHTLTRNVYVCVRHTPIVIDFSGSGGGGYGGGGWGFTLIAQRAYQVASQLGVGPSADTSHLRHH